MRTILALVLALGFSSIAAAQPRPLGSRYLTQDQLKSRSMAGLKADHAYLKRSLRVATDRALALHDQKAKFRGTVQEAGHMNIKIDKAFLRVNYLNANRAAVFAEMTMRKLNGTP